MNLQDKTVGSLFSITKPDMKGWHLLLMGALCFSLLVGCGKKKTVSGFVGGAGPGYILVTDDSGNETGLLLSEDAEIAWADAAWEDASYGYLAGFQVSVIPGDSGEAPEGYIQEPGRSIPWYQAEQISVTGASDALSLILGRAE